MDLYNEKKVSRNSGTQFLIRNYCVTNKIAKLICIFYIFICICISDYFIDASGNLFSINILNLNQISFIMAQTFDFMETN